MQNVETSSVVYDLGSTTRNELVDPKDVVNNMDVSKPLEPGQKTVVVRNHHLWTEVIL